MTIPERAPALRETITDSLRRRTRLKLTPLPRGGLYARGGKRALSLTLLVALMPFVLLVAFPIALANLLLFCDPRRVFFLQPRVGVNGRVFRIWKFRTMRRDSPDERNAFHSWSAGVDRLRVTRFGRFLRNTHLDELPQLVNVLKGEMDLVGPRPEMIEIHEWASELIPGFPQRCAIRPGITGLAQVTQGYAGKDEDAYAAKLDADLEYIESFSLAGDLRILGRTALWMLAGKGWRRARHRRATIRPWQRPASSPAPRSSSTTPDRVIPSARRD